MSREAHVRFSESRGLKCPRLLGKLVSAFDLLPPCHGEAAACTQLLLGPDAPPSQQRVSDTSQRTLASGRRVRSGIRHVIHPGSRIRTTSSAPTSSHSRRLAIV